jgi:hypothetical protein
MTYPTTPGYQRDSETSREAAEKLNPKKYIQQTLDFLAERGSYGATADELAQHLEAINGRVIANTTAGARLTELLAAGKIAKSGIRRMTRYGRAAEAMVLAPTHTPYTETLPMAFMGVSYGN